MHNIGISLGMLDSLSDGLGEFSTQICQRIAAVAPAWRDEGVQFHLHMPRRWHGHFGNTVSYLETRRSQGHWHWQGWRRFTGWHGLNQLGRAGPPAFTQHSLLTIHDLNTLYHDDPRTCQKSLLKLQSRLRKFKSISTLTHHVEGDIRKHLGWSGPVSVIPNGARDLTSHPQTPVPGLPTGRFLLHLSRMAASKNPQALVELAAHWPEQTVVMAGPRSVGSDLVRAQGVERGLANLHVIQEVSDEQKAWLYAHCQGFLFPSLTEGFGLPPLEAMHFGKPVFLSRLTSLPEVGGTWAAYFDSFDPAEMRRCIESESPRLLANANGIRAHAGQFTWDRSAQSYLAIYRRWLQEPALPGRPPEHR